MISPGFFYRKRFALFLAVTAGLVFSFTSEAQQLIPDPGFEIKDRVGESQHWRQASGEFNHFYSEPGILPFQGGGYHGLCMYRNEPNEFMHTALIQPLQAGQVYRLSMWLRWSRQGDEVIKDDRRSEMKAVHAYFSPYPIQVQQKLFLYVSPQVLFPVKEDLFLNWRKVEAEFVATGEERFITIGNFTNVAEHETLLAELELIKDSIDALRQKRDDEIDSVRTLIMSETQHQGALQEYDPQAVFPQSAAGKSKQPRLSRKERKEAERVKLRNQELNLRFRAEEELIRKKYDGEIKELEIRYEFRKNPFSVNMCFDEVHLEPVQGEKGTISDPLSEVPVEGKVITLRKVYFNTAKSELLPASSEELDKLFLFLNANPDVSIRICGHTDSEGTDEYNRRLSHDRSNSVKAYLVQKGIQQERLQIAGFGSKYPVADNESEEGRAMNRRVEFYVLPSH